MSVIVDEAIWPWKGKLWAHLVSDTSLIELHDFTVELGIRRMAFQGDHYDISKEMRRRAIDLGALPVGSRELIVSLRKANLRLPASKRPGSWSEITFPSLKGDFSKLDGFIPKRLKNALENYVITDWHSALISVFRRLNEFSAVVNNTNGVSIKNDLPSQLESRCTDGTLLEILYKEEFLA